MAEASTEATDSDLCNGMNTSDEFEIPELPQGRKLRFIFLNSWDDPCYIGLNTIEIFNDNGRRPSIQCVESNAKETNGDLQNVIYNDRTRPVDRHKLWSARYDSMLDPVFVLVSLEDEERIAMIRIWNYDESRVHALRGVHDLVIMLEDKVIFQGEITCAFTGDQDVRPMGDTILFTTDEAILEKIAENDVCLVDEDIMAATMDLLAADTETKAAVNAPRLASPSSSTSCRPSTGVASKVQLSKRLSPESLSPYDAKSEASNNVMAAEVYIGDSTSQVLQVQVLHMELLENWGAPDCIGLTGIQFLSFGGAFLNSPCHITASSRSDTVNRLLNGRNLTRNREDMWLIPYSCHSPPPRITVSFPSSVPLTGLCVWNYNASLEMSYAGVRRVQLYFDGKPLAQSIQLRKAPGFVFFDFVQDILLDRSILYRPPSRLNSATISGFIYQLRLLSTWGDEFYIGMNGIELYDLNEQPIKLGPQNIAAFPESVNILPGVHGDPRTSENLIDGVNETTCASHMWLAPVLPNRCARVFVIFDYPMTISKMILYNYTKTPERGVRHLTVSVDDLIVFSGEVPPSTVAAAGKLVIMLRE